MKNITISTEYITLGQFLKFAHIIQNGGEAKFFLESNKVIIDGVEDNRRGRKLYPESIVEINGQSFKVIAK
ncbi:MAG: S4 domain-containing protein YaaA [Bacilli bacterium]|nr:S4 domain-containing protein YaaA [Bacilli bacterium]